MNKPNVLIDLKVAMNNGYCGIGNENRLVFKMLAQAESLSANGLLISDNAATIFSHYQPSPSRDEGIAQANRFFHEALDHELLLKNKLLQKLKLTNLFALKKNKFQLYDIDPLFHDVIWRNVFDKTLSAADKDLILNRSFHFTDMTGMHQRAASYLKRKTYLNTTGYDSVLFLEPTDVMVTPGTKKIVRYHDAIPITDPDFAGSVFSHRNMHILHACAKDAYFVCNSEPTRAALLALKPELESRSVTIPACIANSCTKVNNPSRLRDIIAMRLSSALISRERLLQINQKMQSEKSFRYFFHLATLDPKKNQINLIRAWEKFSYQFGDEIKLVIAANAGWLSKDIEEAMRPHVERGNIIHIDRIASDEIAYLYSHAEAFIFPSYTEGFGLPPIEAMQCECPTIVSDIPTHRWVMGEASLYCNPYDADAIMNAMTALTYAADAASVRTKLIAKGLQQAAKYSEESLKSQWEAVLHT